VAPSQSKFEAADRWLEENGLIMEQPSFPLLPRKYLVTGDLKVTTMPTIQPKDKEGNQRWKILGCRSAPYTPATNSSCSPANFGTTGCPVNPGAAMPVVNGCRKPD